MFVSTQQCKEIKQCLTHSWHGHAWNKVFGLLILKNGLVCFICRNTGSLGHFCPWFQRLPPLGRLKGHIAASGWYILAGSLFSCLALWLWRATSKVFLEKICIEQEDPCLKAEGVMKVV